MEMKRKVLYAVGTLLVIGVLMLGNYMCYKSAYNQMSVRQQEYEENMHIIMQKEITDAVDADIKKWKKEVAAVTEEPDSVEADAKNDKLDIQTIYQIQNYNRVTDKTLTDYENLPEELIGYTREDMDSYCKRYMQNLPANEYLDGLQSMGVVSFSAERLVVKKVYDVSKIKYRYYLIALEGEVVVYYGDKKTVYEYTGIETDKLSDKERKALKNGIDVKDEDELFGILENYSS